ncbi:MAG: quinate 5-dehydrogenase [Desulfotomaculum sp.]|nr:quinate 5-dehydrogenase [Desulfotomaculum sp.]
MKRVVSVSLGSSKRDHSVTIELLGEKFEVSRVGTDGDFNKAIEKLKELDGKVSAIGLGGIDIYLYAGKKRYMIRDSKPLVNAVKKTPVVDGSGLKNSLERETIKYLSVQGYLKPGTRVLMTSAVDRFGMAEALEQVGCDITCGDLIFGMGIPFPVKTVAKLNSIAEKLLPVVTRLPFNILYPTGKKQERQDAAKAKKFERYYHRADVIAGDFHFIRKYLPSSLNGQMIITNTTTSRDVEMLTERGAGMLVTTTPEFNGRSFGTNVIEALLVAILGKNWEDITPGEYIELLKKLDFKPRVLELNKNHGIGRDTNIS